MDNNYEENNEYRVLPDWQRKPQLPEGYIKETDKESVLRDHGVTGAIPDWQRKPQLPEGYVRETDKESALRDHGATGAIPDWQRKPQLPKDYVPETDKESVLRDHGATGAVPIGKSLYGTDDKEIQKTSQNIIHAIAYQDLGQTISQLPDETIVKILEQRFRRVANYLENKAYNKDIVSKYLSFDLTFIEELLKSQKDLSKLTINATNKLGGENYQNIIGLLDEYEARINQQGNGLELPDKETTPTEKIEQIKELAYELGYGVDHKSR